MAIHVELLRGKLSRARAGQGRPAELGAVAAGGGGTTVIAETSREAAADAGELNHVGIIADEIRRLDHLVNGLLKFTRPEDLKLEPLDLSQLVQQIVQVVQPEAERSHVNVETSMARDLPDVYGDPGMLQTAFLNLALNAVQAMPTGGTLHIRTARARGRNVSVTFEDSGVGIAPENLGKIFDLYFTTKEHGSGIGLALVYRTILLHDGTIEVESSPGRTAFTVRLPVV
jgi:signal transduction histidine kinase